MTTTAYRRFIEQKTAPVESNGISSPHRNDTLYPWQWDLTRWALKKGRAAIFADCGLGKTLMQLTWASQIPGPVLIVAPLAVAEQTAREGRKHGLPAEVVRNQPESLGNRTFITNYQMLHHFHPIDWMAIVLDESSILKNFDGHYRTMLTTDWQMRYRLCCTATPAPNDLMELGTHAEFLGQMKRAEMLARFFIHDGGDTSKWRLKKHGEDRFWEWVSSWGLFVRRPSDLGYPDDEMILPRRFETQHVVRTAPQPGSMFPSTGRTLMDRRRARSETVADRVAAAARLISNEPDEAWVVWCGLNSESSALANAIPGATEIRGSDSLDHRRDAMIGFQSGTHRVIVTKPSIAGHGLNWQHCARMIFVGLSDSWEQWYQAVRRCWRFGQTRDVHIHVVTADREGAVVTNIRRKEEAADRTYQSVAKHTRRHVMAQIKDEHTEHRMASVADASGDGWDLLHGDCVERLAEVESASVGHSVFSPPFASLYTYSSDPRDMGNCPSNDDFLDHFRFLVKELRRVMMPGRSVAVHCMNIPILKSRAGYIGLYDFRGEMVRTFTNAGFIWHSEVCIWKDPVTQMQRTKALGLLHKTILKDSSMSRMGLPDYLLTFRNPGDNPEPISHDPSQYPVEKWQRVASPVWSDINPSDTLQFRSARDNRDERHICPLQLPVIERAIDLWSNRGDLVLSPFAGIGSEGHVAIRRNRRFVGIELKDSYFAAAVSNLRSAENAKNQRSLFSVA